MIPVAFLLVVGSWIGLALMYKRVYGAALKWWAYPLAKGALMFNQRLPRGYEKP